MSFELHGRDLRRDDRVAAGQATQRPPERSVAPGGLSPALLCGRNSRVCLHHNYRAGIGIGQAQMTPQLVFETRP
jgi:hypothetical protein